MATPSVFSAGNTALISGAASGIGLAVAQLCRKHGMRLFLLDRNKDQLADAERSLSANKTSASANAEVASFSTATPPEVRTFAVDVSKLEDWFGVKKALDGEKIDFLMLNAGIGAKGSWEDSEYFRKIMDTNLFGVINGINAFFPLLQRTKSESRAAIVITGSKQGITNPPGNPAYNASKSAVKTLAEHLSYDLKDTNTSAHLLVPGWTFTGLTGGGGLKEKPAGAWYPSQVADYMFKKIAEDKFYIICPDNDVTEDTDKRRMLWSVGDIVYERPPLTRWRPEFKQQAEEWMAKQKI